MIWVATVVGLILLVLLIVFIAQNQDQVTLHYFGFTGQVNLGLALFIASVAGGLVTAVAAASRIVQLRAKSNKQRKARTRQ
ncbi:lipopolysaccharide assembly protein LapA domain-containing protein [Glutamicibacter sp. V16R2B1]|uniref:LapA family protein n=1 Tax=Glutamicibacter sp. V16R2B1 TaxID=2036207 RepID=UPI002016B514|nr:lipopolysaccharide assembly protein LapA domain-containing protein [Glutamicibacter sp. V16R2B1]